MARAAIMRDRTLDDRQKGALLDLANLTERRPDANLDDKVTQDLVLNKLWNADDKKREVRDFFRGLAGGAFGSRRSRLGIRKGRRGQKHVEFSKAQTDGMPRGRGFKVRRGEDMLRPNEIGEAGFADPQRIRTSQSTFGESFKEASKGGERRTIRTLMDDIRSGRKSPNDIEPIRLVVFNGKVYTLDHRRLVAFRRLSNTPGFENIRIKYKKVEFGSLSNNQQTRIRRARRINEDGLTIPHKSGKYKE